MSPNLSHHFFENCEIGRSDFFNFEWSIYYIKIASTLEYNELFSEKYADKNWMIGTGGP